MTKMEEEKLLKRVNNLEKQVAALHSRLENNKLEKHTYSVLETAHMLGVTKMTVYNMIEKGQLETVKLGHIRVLGNSLREKLGCGQI